MNDFDTLRWDIRSDGKRGFLFYNNQQPDQSLPEHKDVQFSVKTTAGTALIPSQPVDHPSGTCGIWPINLDCDGVTLDYATVQPLCRAMDNTDSPVYSSPSFAKGRKLLLDVHYIGDAACHYIGDKLYDDNFYNGDHFSVALWRIPATDWPNLRINVLPYFDGLLGRLPQEARDIVDQARKDLTLDQVTIVAEGLKSMRNNKSLRRQAAVSSFPSGNKN